LGEDGPIESRSLNAGANEKLEEAFESAFGSISWSNEKTKEFSKIVDDFFQKRPFEKIIEVDKQSDQQIHKIRMTAPLPKQLANVAKDAASNLRDALDHAVYASTSMLSGKADPSDTGFPFGADAASISQELNGRRLRGNAPEIRATLEALQPYSGGNDPLYRLNKLRNPNTHRVIVPVIAASMGNTLQFSGSITGPSQLGYNHWDPVARTVEFMRVGAGSDFDYKVTVSWAVTFGAIEAVKGLEVVTTLRTMSSDVEAAVTAIKVETARILGARSAVAT